MIYQLVSSQSITLPYPIRILHSTQVASSANYTGIESRFRQVRPQNRLQRHFRNNDRHARATAKEKQKKQMRLAIVNVNGRGKWSEALASGMDVVVERGGGGGGRMFTGNREGSCVAASNPPQQCNPRPFFYLHVSANVNEQTHKTKNKLS